MAGLWGSVDEVPAAAPAAGEVSCSGRTWRAAELGGLHLSIGSTELHHCTGSTAALAALAAQTVEQEHLRPLSG
jgi:hypothetical protein